jgi:hypothetical protein
MNAARKMAFVIDPNFVRPQEPSITWRVSALPIDHASTACGASSNPREAYERRTTISKSALDQSFVRKL